jgi:hypothetical protein
MSTPSGPDRRADTPGARPATSRLAVASAVLGALSSALFCCGMGVAGPLALIAGVLALRQISASDGVLRGRRLAWAGIALGALGLVLTLAAQSLVRRVQESLNGDLEKAVEVTFAALDDDDDGDAVGRWMPAAGRRIGREDVRGFAQEARARYGAFESMTVLETETPELSLMENHRLHMAVAFRFVRTDATGERTGGERVDGEVVAILVPGMTSLLPDTRIESIVIVDPKAGALELRGRPAAREEADEAPEEEATRDIDGERRP